MKDFDLPGALYIASVVLLCALLIWIPWPDSDETEERERSRNGQSRNFDRKSNFDRKFDYCMREHGVDASGAFLKCLSKPLPR